MTDVYQFVETPKSDAKKRLTVRVDASVHQQLMQLKEKGREEKKRKPPKSFINIEAAIEHAIQEVVEHAASAYAQKNELIRR